MGLLRWLTQAAKKYYMYGVIFREDAEFDQSEDG